MRATKRQDAQINPSELGKLRPLGKLEHIIWLIDQAKPMHFAVAAEIAGAPKLDDWTKALYLVQLRHPLLSVRIEGRQGGVPWFHRTHCAIPLRTVEAAEEDWEAVVGQELETPFDPHAAPLVRAVLINDDDRCVFILVAHHAIADGMSLVYLVRDVLRALGAAPLEVLPTPPSQDDLLALANPLDPEGAGAPGSAPPGPAGVFRQKDGTHPTVESRRLCPELTARVRDRARQERASVHGAVCAALVIAGRPFSLDWCNTPLRFLSPFDARQILGVGEDCGLYVNATSLVFEPGATPFWDVARHATASARAGKSSLNLQTILGVVEGVLASGADVQSACEFAANAFAREAVVTNLGAVPVDFRFCAVEVKAIWGPMVLSGFAGDQSIGVASFDGALHLTHVSHTPFPGLLAATERTLADAC